jgi:hypothetical protein
MIFPGMDPYLEDPQLWHGVHNSMVVYLRDHLQPQLDSRYVAAVEERVFVEGPDREIIPDTWLARTRSPAAPGVAVLDADAPVEVQVTPLEIHESYVAILDRQSGHRVVTIIEVVSPTNKFAGPGRLSYETKQREVLGSQTHLVEIDLLRSGPHVLAVPEWAARGKGPYDYLVCINRAHGLRDRYQLHPVPLQARLPRVGIPLAGGDPDVTLDLQAVLCQTYDAGRYRERIRYDRPCQPPLLPVDQAWADSIIQQSTASTG